MSILQRAANFGKREFAIRRLHSLLGLLPIGGYLIFHLATNAAIIDGPATYQYRSDQIHYLGPSTIFVLEWLLIFLPILFHGIIGLLIALRGQANPVLYPYGANIRYTLERVTGVIALAFILWHVWEMHGWLHFRWWVENVARPLGGAHFDPLNAPATAAAAIQSSWWVTAAYIVGVTAAVYHFANGLWTFGITWGIWTSPRAQRWAIYPCAAIGVVLLVIGLGAVWGMARVNLDEVPKRVVSAQHQ